MSDYQATYDAIRSRIQQFDGHALKDEILNKMDISYYSQNIQNEIMYVVGQYNKPSSIYRPSLSIDGNKWCALYGDNLQDGVAGFGDSPQEAMDDFNINFIENING